LIEGSNVSMSHARMYCKTDAKVPVSKQKQKRKRKAGLGRIRVRSAFFLLVILMCTAWWQADQAASTDGSASQLNHDLKQLWHLSNSYFATGETAVDWSIRWEFTTGSLHAQNKLMETLFPKDKYRGAIPKRITNNGKTITGTIEGMGQISLHNIEQTEESGRFIIIWSFVDNKANRLTEEKLLKAALAIDEAVAPYTADPAIAIKLQGDAHSDWTSKDWDKLTQAERLQNYEDDGLKSALYFTSKLKTYVWLKEGYKANMQIALHEQTESDSYKLTIGVPAISGEF